jgi:hypothetical protein
MNHADGAGRKRIKRKIINRLTSVRLFLQMAFLIVIFPMASICAAPKVSISPLAITWNAQTSSFEAHYWVLNDSDSTQQLSTIIVFQAENVKWWRGVALPKPISC